MEFYKIKGDKIKFTNKISHQDIVFIYDNTAGYIWKGEKAIDLDEFTAKKIDGIIKERFENISFVLIPELEEKKEDNPKIIQIKKALSERLPHETIHKIKEKKDTVFTKLKKNIKEFKNYENSWKWRKKLSNLTNLWKLAIFNIVILTFSMIFIFNISIFHLNLGDYFLFIAFILLFSICIINLIFVIFPMKFPVNVLGLEGKVEEVKEKSVPPKPITPKTKKGMSKKKPVKQLEIAPLKSKKSKAKKKGKTEKKKVEGEEYLSEEDLALGIPAIPEAPKKKKKITIESAEISEDMVQKIKKMEDKNTVVVLVNCERCKSVIPVPVPKKKILKSELPVVPFSYVHQNLENKDQHCITIHLDHDFDIRRQRLSDVVLSK
ncbi:MAG: hypothetical protein EU544_06165 [Promethearchaeota archaeon]|nr:MAG: hypothetical protein EU544_06165 [Candidatus Lokiarchaeota archaeon]